jgi:Pvc16 N-terminal domain/Carboxypeptidase regulatory-like domain
MFADLDEALKQLLIREVPLPVTDVDVAFERPDRDRVARFSRPTVNLFLFQLEENKEQIDTGWQTTRNDNGTATIRWPPLRVDLRYLVTVWSQNVDDEHELLFHLYRTLRRFPELPDDLREGALQRQPRSVVLEVDEGMDQFRGLLDLWSVLDNAMRAGLVLKATVAVDLNGVQEVPVVRTSGLRIGPMGQAGETRYQITGRVLNAEGGPVAGARLRANKHSRTTLTDRDGSYVITGLPGPDVDIQVEAAGFYSQERLVTLPGDYDIALAPANGPDPPRRRRGGGGT